MKSLLWQLLVCLPLLTCSQDIQTWNEQKRAAVVDQILEERLQTLLPALMRQTGFDMWVVISREYNEDPVIRTMMPATWFAARRRTILVYYQPPGNSPLEKMAISRYNIGNTIKASWDMEKFPEAYDQLADMIRSRNPKKIGVNYSTSFGHADGLDYTEYQELMERLPSDLQAKVTSAEDLAVRWLETRTETEMMIYPKLIEITHQIIREGFSSNIITPGITTSEDVCWWFRDRFRQLGLDTWFHPSVDIQRNDSTPANTSFAARQNEQVIRPGDLLHVDIGITLLRLNTDVQQHAYVLRPGETEEPATIREALGRANKVQDILVSRFIAGQTGNQILSSALKLCREQGLQATIYTHPLGFHGHAAGPTIGLWDNQQGVKGSGDYPLHEKTVFSIELNCSTYIPEWKKPVRIMLEEDGYFDGKTFRFIQGRQQKMIIIGQ